MIEYIININTGCMVYQEDENEIVKGSSLGYVKRLCQEHLFTYEGYLKAVKMKFDINHKIPLFISESIQLIPSARTRDYDNIWVNYATIFRIEEMEKSVRITFYSSHHVYLNISLKTFKQQIRYLEEIRNTKVKHFHR